MATVRQGHVVNKFRTAVKKEIHRTEIPMTELAKKANVGRPYLYRVLSGEQDPSLKVAERIARALGLTIEIHSENTT